MKGSSVDASKWWLVVGFSCEFLWGSCLVLLHYQTLRHTNCESKKRVVDSIPFDQATSTRAQVLLPNQSTAVTQYVL